MLDKKTIVVTGGLGHIGSRLIRSFGSTVNEIRIVDNLATQRYPSLFDLPETPRVRFYEEDILTANLGEIFKGADVVVHLAAITNAEATVGKEEETEAVNFEGLKRVADACEKTGAKLIFPSTTSVYGSQEAVVDETCADLQPQSPYAVSKLKAEEYLTGKRGTGLKFVTLRLGTIFGWSVGIRFHTAVNKFIWQAVNGKEITVWKTAWEQKRPYLDLGDCVRVFNHVIESDRASSEEILSAAARTYDLFDGEIYNVVTKNFTVRDVVEGIQKFVPSLRVKYVDSKIMNQLSYDVVADKIASKGFVPKGDLSVAIGETIDKLKTIVRTSN
ncbi:MAG: NAD-dependent epimerase/dehydratase [Parcubacteria group bacterium Gr01-1014_8]|nr:MAG: NAD-dependent epimerase/dehydratase [Parcubacteria group bacterium Gr01-1014_8]